MHPNTKPTVTTIVLCMVILGILLLPLPFIAYKILNCFLSLGILIAAKTSLNANPESNARS